MSKVIYNLSNIHYGRDKKKCSPTRSELLYTKQVLLKTKRSKMQYTKLKNTLYDFNFHNSTFEKYYYILILFFIIINNKFENSSFK